MTLTLTLTPILTRTLTVTVTVTVTLTLTLTLTRTLTPTRILTLTHRLPCVSFGAQWLQDVVPRAAATHVISKLPNPKPRPQPELKPEPKAKPEPKPAMGEEMQKWWKSIVEMETDQRIPGARQSKREQALEPPRPPTPNPHWARPVLRLTNPNPDPNPN